MVRIILLAIISLITAIFPLVIIAGIEGNTPPGYLLYIFIMIVVSSSLPTLLAAFIFYLLVRKMHTNKINTSKKWITGIVFILICELVFNLWTVVDWLTSGNLTWEGFKITYKRDFAGGNYPILIGGMLLTYLYFIGFLSSVNSSPKPGQGYQTNDNE